MKGNRVQEKKTGLKGTVTKVIGKCLWVKMDTGEEYSGATRYWKVLKDAPPAR